MNGSDFSKFLLLIQTSEDRLDNLKNYIELLTLLAVFVCLSQQFKTFPPKSSFGRPWYRCHNFDGFGKDRWSAG